eukprot:38854-Prorocentrum_minimum.AAC.1
MSTSPPDPLPTPSAVAGEGGMRSPLGANLWHPSALNEAPTLMYAAADKTQDRTPGFVADHDAAEAVVALGSPGGARGRAARHHTDGEKLRSTRLTEGVRRGSGG